MIKLLPPLLFISAMSTALVLGIFYAFSSFVMAGLAVIPSEQGINAKSWPRLSEQILRVDKWSLCRD